MLFLITLVASNVANNHSDPAAMDNNFNDVCKDIFRAGFTSERDISEMQRMFDFKCYNFNWQHFSSDESFMTYMQLKHNKKDTDIELYSSAFINAPFKFIKLICLLINAFIAHGHVPKNWLSSLL